MTSRQHPPGVLGPAGYGAVPLPSASYATWSRTVIVPETTAFAYKFVKKDGSGNVTWESGTNRSYTTGGSSGYTTSDTWK